MAPRILFVLVIAAATASCYPQSAWWDRFQPADFPARVAAIEFPGGRKLTKATPVPHGAWTVALGENPQARAHFAGHLVSRVTVSGLSCTNKVIGTVPCTLSMTRIHSSPFLYGHHRPAPCVFFLGHDQPPLPVECPVSASLER